MTKCNEAEFNGWCIKTGIDFRRTFTVKDLTLPKIPNPEYDSAYPESQSNLKELSQPKDLTGYTAKMDIREGATRADTLIYSLETGVGITIGSPDPSDGTVEIFIDSTVTSSFSPLKSYYDIVLIPPGVGEDNIRILFGTIDIEEIVTDV